MARAKLCDVCNIYVPKKQIIKFPAPGYHLFPKNMDVCHGCMRAIFRNIEPGEGEITERDWKRAVDLATAARWRRNNSYKEKKEETEP